MGPNLNRLEKVAKNVLWSALGLIFSKREKQQLPLDLSKIKSVLVLRPDRLGDVVLSTPVYESIKASLPGVRLTALVNKSNTGLLKNNPNVDEILAWNPKRPWSIFRRLRREKFDLAFTLNKTFSATASVLTHLSGAACRVGYKSTQNAWIYDMQVATDGEPRHEIENNLELLKAAGMTEVNSAPALFFDVQETEKIAALLKEKRKHPDRRLILIKPGTRVPEWGWRLNKFRKVTEELLKSETVEVFLISGPGEGKLTDDFMRGMKRPPVRLPPLSVNELALLIQKSGLLLCNHTGIMHLASAVRTPVLAIFKHGEIARWGPYNTPNVVLEERNSEALSPETVLQSINELLGRAKSELQEELEL
ncbi:MAG: glycosyl transferase family 9 [Nitrospinaceae bacterium]|nr:MAG: glycosyl transferase family 9 [Nitrospinaceae bacterium]